MFLDQARVQLIHFVAAEDTCPTLLLVAVQVLLAALDSAQAPSLLLDALLS